MANHVRIIAGYWRGKHINIADNTLVRPTGDRIRETLFNWLGSHIHQARCLDLFCGSGILGIEALSRGAAQVTFIDNDVNVIAQLKKTIADLPKAQRPQLFLNHQQIPLAVTTLSPIAYVLQQDALLATQHAAYDIIFLDPPFNSTLLEQCIPLLKEQGYEKPGTLIYIELQATQSLTLPEHWHILRQGKAGNVRYHLIEVTT